MDRIPLPNLFYDLSRNSELVNNSPEMASFDVLLPTTQCLMKQMTPSECRVFQQSMSDLLEKRLKSLLHKSTENEFDFMSEEQTEQNKTVEPKKTKKRVRFAKDTKPGSGVSDDAQSTTDSETVLEPPKRKFFYPRLIPVLKEPKPQIWNITNNFDEEIMITDNITENKSFFRSTNAASVNKNALNKVQYSTFPGSFTANRPMKKVNYSLGWFGAISEISITQGQCTFKVLVTENEKMMSGNAIGMFLNEMPSINGFRIGFSLASTERLLGETNTSFAYCESGRLANNSKYSEYGKPFGINDVIECTLDMNVNPCTIKFVLNGFNLGEAFAFVKNEVICEYGLVAHIVSRSYEFHVVFDDDEERCECTKEVSSKKAKLNNKSNNISPSNNQKRFSIGKNDEKSKNKLY
ncbi:uncharacterized protein LOC119684676 isoform X1 [Teleopsis dalmanni]|uniref:uncharacterized protein LOC119684676 isoform X1 n=1 Tax=Teleopsis dalmanni TaxID=139649 RepID=UPI0018CD08A1|nr:uncharacterized protein LOC119684676 isoform X1 [Teleopsis dalmanni]